MMDKLISQQAAIDALRTCYDTCCIDYTNGGEYIDYEMAVELIEALPSAQPEIKTDGETISRQAAIDALDCINGTEEVLRSLPSAQPERKTGRWISMTSYNNSYRCSVCGRMLINISDGKNMVTKNYPFCHCGAKMLEKGEE